MRRPPGTPPVPDETVARVVAASMSDPDPRVRARSLQFFFNMPHPAGWQRALELLAGDRRLHAGVPDEVSDDEARPTLEDGLWRVVAGALGRPGPALDAARKALLATLESFAGP